MPEQNITNIPSSRVDFIDKRTGMISREWYRFFLNLFNLAGAGGNQVSLDDLQIGPPPQPASSSSTGTVTSVALALPSIMAVSGSPVTTSGTLTGTLTTQAVNTIFAGPSSGAAATPTFRALTTADIPAIGAAITNDISTATNLYPLFSTATSGALTSVNTSDPNLLYTPSTGELTASAHVSSNGIQINATTVATSYTIATGNNGLSAGPVSVNTGATVTVSTGSTWTIV